LYSNAPAFATSLFPKGTYRTRTKGRSSPLILQIHSSAASGFNRNCLLVFGFFQYLSKNCCNNEIADTNLVALLLTLVFKDWYGRKITIARRALTTRQIDVTETRPEDQRRSAEIKVVARPVPHSFAQPVDHPAVVTMATKISTVSCILVMQNLKGRQEDMKKPVK